MTTTQRTVLLALIFAIIASTVLAVDTDAKRKRKHKQRETRASIVREVPNAEVSLPDPNAQASLLPQDLSLRIPNILIPGEPDPCDEVEAILNGFLPQTETLKKTDSFWAKLTLNQGASILACDLGSGTFEVRFNNATIKTYGKLSSNGVSVGGWNHLASLSGEIRVSFTARLTSPNTIVLSNLTVGNVNFENSPNWLDSGAITNALNAMFPSTMTITI